MDVCVGVYVGVGVCVRRAAQDTLRRSECAVREHYVRGRDGDEKEDICIDMLNTNGETPLSIAASNCFSDGVKLLIEYDAYIVRDGMDIDNETALFKA